MTMTSGSLVLLAAQFAAEHHLGQRRYDRRQTPYLMHPLRVAGELRSAGYLMPEALATGLLHDVVEDCDTTIEELRAIFGDEVAHYVGELTDDPRLKGAPRKAEQLARSVRMSKPAKLVRIADKIDNSRDVLFNPPITWSASKRLTYLDWGHEVVVACTTPTTLPLVEVYETLMNSEGAKAVIAALVIEAGRNTMPQVGGP